MGINNTHMKKKILLSCLLTSTMMSLVSCSDDEKFEDIDRPIINDSEISIGASASYSTDNKSRTIYPGITDGKVERINWILDKEYGEKWVADQIRIYSPQAIAGAEHFADYKVISHSQINPDISVSPDGTYTNSFNNQNVAPSGTGTPVSADDGRFIVVEGKQGLKWTTAANHDFYAVYPAPALNSSVDFTSVNGSIQMKGKIASGQNTAGFIKEPNKTNSYMALPVMRQNYMWAITRATETDKAKNAINLSFKTIPTTLEVDLVWPENQNNVTVTTVTLSYTGSDSSINLGGDFTCDFSNLTAEGYPKLVANEATESVKSVIIDLDVDPTDDKVGVTLKGGEHLKVRFLLLPHELDGKDLKLTVAGPNGSRSHALATTMGAFKILPSKINRLKNVRIPGDLKGNNWISLLPDNILLSQLSIPGTGSSYLFYDQGDSRTYAQCKTVEQQWEMGIRCFDITASINADHGGVTDFANVPLRIDNKVLVPKVNGKQITVKDAFDTLLTKVKDTNKDNEPWNGEFGMMILRYQPGGARNAQQFVTDFETFFKNLIDNDPQYKNRFCLFRPGITVKDARGKIMVILCPTSEGEDTAVTFGDSRYLLVDGNGSLPDKFTRRGYYYAANGQTKKVTNPAPNKGGDATASAEYYIVNWDQGILSNKPEEINFVYNTNQGFKAWFQDWTRVIDGTGSDLKAFTSNSGKTVKWPASYQEKLTNVKASFIKAVNNKTNKENVYINSLCGFLVTGEDTYTDSEGKVDNGQYTPIYGGWPSYASNIKKLAQKINPDFYIYMHEQLATGGVKGPMGVVLMNFVGDTSIPGCVLMPSVVISNNFTFPLLTGTPGTVDPTPTPTPDSSDPMPNGDGTYDAGGWLWGE